MPVRSIRTFTVLPHLPDRLQPLQKLAYNLWWCWNHDAIALFRRIDPEKFEEYDHSPVKLLGNTDQARFEQLVKDDGFLAHMERVEEGLDHYMSAPTWFHDTYGADNQARIAYLSMEFGIHESIPVYSGGLGVLAGDHLKSASDLGLPLCGVSLMYREGYFRQYLNIDGWQQERYPENDFFNLPLIPETKPDGTRFLISVSLPGREVMARIWRIQVGRVPLYLLDCNIPQARSEDRNITAQLYGGDIHTRIQQEIVLGIGGIRALRALGKDPTVCHMNEGHAAFCALERVRSLIAEQGYDFATAAEAVKAGTCFTTHTPVPAGNDAFPPHMMDEYFSEFMKGLKLSRSAFLNLGRERPDNEGEPFSMTVLALRMSNVANGVSKLHGRVSRHMWRGIWPELPEVEVPISSITNGVHTASWVAPEISQLYDRYLGAQWQEQPTNFAIWKRVETIPDAELWRTHERRRERLVAFARARFKAALRRLGAPPSQIEAADEVLDPEALTIGFARRFATYKRGNLIFRDLERVAAIVNNKERPVQFIFAGKAHPRDTAGKELIAQVAQLARRPEFRRRVVFIEDYDMSIARYMIQGVDVWLNNPRRPLEASGTSGMKVCGNGGLNLSVLDGWWDEGYTADNGWAIGSGEEYGEDQKTYQDDVESRSIYELIEQEIVPLFYTRGSDGLPRGWVKRMKRSVTTNVPVFNTNRMVKEYTELCYMPSHRRYAKLAADQFREAAQLAQWRKRLADNWGQIRVENVEAPPTDPLHVGAELPIKVRMQLGSVNPEDLEVQLFHGAIDSLGQITQPQTARLQLVGSPEPSMNGSRVALYSGTIPCRSSGHYGYCVRVLPKHPALPHPFEPGLVTWG
jgi:glycogen phosphorylase